MKVYLIKVDSDKVGWNSDGLMDSTPRSLGTLMRACTHDAKIKVESHPYYQRSNWWWYQYSQIDEVRKVRV